MAGGSGDTIAPTRRQRAQRAASIRKRLKADKTVTDEQRAELNAWDAAKGAKPGRKPDKVAAAEPTSDKPITPEATADKPPAKAPADKAPPNAPPEKPPKIPAGQRTGRADWRQKYGGGPAMGREMTCVLCAGAWKKLMMRLNVYIATENDGVPMFTEAELDAEFMGAAVLTADTLLPDDFEITPPMIIGVGTTMIVTKAALAARAKKKRKLEDPTNTGPGSRAKRKADVVDIKTREPVAENPSAPEPDQTATGVEGHRSVTDDANDDDVV